MKTKVILFLTTFAALLFTIARAQSAAPLEDARAALKANDLAKAESLLLPLTGADAKDAAAFFTLGQVRERQKILKEAVAAYEQATKLDATKAEYFSTLGIALSKRMGEMSFMQQAMVAGKMKNAFEKAVQLDPNNVTGLIGLSRYYANAPEIAGGSPEKAKEYANRVLALVPFLGELEFGNIAEKSEDFTGALGHFEAGAKLNPGHAGAQFDCGRMLVKLAKKDDARARFEAALKLYPDFDAAKKALAELDAPPAAPAETK